MLVLWKNAEKGAASSWVEDAALEASVWGGFVYFARHGSQLCSRLTYLDSLLQ
jgi:hypothetical protein